MAHFAFVDESGIVRNVIVINNADCGGGDFPASEPIGQAFITSLGLCGEARQCSYSGSFRAAYPGQGWTFDAVADEFTPPPVSEPITPESP